MNSGTKTIFDNRQSDVYRTLLLSAAMFALLCLFWFASRYPQLFTKAAHLGQVLPSMAYGKELLHVAADAPLWQRIIFGAVNWLEGMKIGMSFGVLFGALLHTYLQYRPLKIGQSLHLNSVKGALVGVPMGVCANCAVPMACGVTRANGRVETALGFLFSSPNFNPVVVMMTFTALPLAMCLVKYAILLLVILVLVPGTIGFLERNKPLLAPAPEESEIACAVLPIPAPGKQPFRVVVREVAVSYAKNVWMLFKPTIAIMLVASVVASIMLALVPWQSLLASATPARMFLVSIISVFMPVPIALDVMFAAQLRQQGVDAGYVMLFAMTLGTFSVVPSIYLWREISKPLAAILFTFFVLVGFILGVAF